MLKNIQILFYLTVFPFIEQSREVLLSGYGCHLTQSKLTIHRNAFLHI